MKKAKPTKGSARVKKFDRGGTIGALAGLGTLAYLLSRKKNEDKASSGDEIKPLKEAAESKTPIQDTDERFKGASSGEPKEPAAPEQSKTYKAEPSTKTAEPTKPLKTTPTKKPVVAAKKPASTTAPTTVISKAPTRANAAAMESGVDNRGSGASTRKPYINNPMNTETKTSPMFVREVANKNADLKVPFDLKGGNKTVYGVDTTTLYKQQAEREKAAAEAKAKSKAEDAKRAKEFRERSMSPLLKKGGAVKKYASGGSVSSASKRADGCACRGKTRGKMV